MTRLIPVVRRSTVARAHRRRGPGVAVALALVAVLPACTGGGDDAGAGQLGGTGGDAGAKEAVTAAAAAAATAGAAAFTLDVTTTAGDQTVALTGEGQLDPAIDAVAMSLTTDVPGTGEVSLEQIFIADVFYLRGFPGLEEQWVRATVDELGSTGLNSSTGQTDPSSQLQLLQYASEVTEDGTEDVNGVSTTKYAGTIDLAAAATAEEGEDAQALTEAYAELGLSDLPFELYLDEEGLPARMLTDLASETGGQSLAVNSTIDFSDWGSEVTIEPPADSISFAEVTDGQG